MLTVQARARERTPRGLFRGRLRGSLRRDLLVSAVSLALCLAPGPVALATAQKAGKPARRIVQSVPPEYPATLLAVRVGGLVRLNVTVSASGNVTKIELLGGNPILSDSAIKAVSKWKYAPAAAETTHEVQIRFNPDSPNIP